MCLLPCLTFLEHFHICMDCDSLQGRHVHEVALYFKAIRCALLCRHQRQAEVLRCLEAVCGAAEVQAEPWAHVRRKRRRGQQLTSQRYGLPPVKCTSVSKKEALASHCCSDLPSLASADVCAAAVLKQGFVEESHAPAAQEA